MAKISDPSDVEYLVFQGGGGKGVAYAGALQALEEFGILPVKPGSESQLKGIAGTSAGAITALMLAMGYTSNEIDKQFLSNPETFTPFFDGPDTGSYRTVSPFNRPGRSERSAHVNVNETLEDFLKEIRKRSFQNPALRVLGVTVLSFLHGHSNLNALLKRPAPEALLMLFKGADASQSHALAGKLAGKTLKRAGGDWLLQQLLKLFLSSSDPEEVNHAAEAISNRLYDYLYNVFFDLGFFPGFKIREFFQTQITLRFNDIYGEEKNIKGATLDFRDFYELTGCNLMFTGVNVTKNDFQFFSKDHTPNFPVAEAAAISMNIPVVFKPVHVQRRDLEGFWVDGGTVNNLPLHAFDYVEKPELLTRFREELYAYLHPNVLALSLIQYLPGEEPGETKISPADRVPVMGFLGNLVNVMWDSNESQIKREIEREQIIQIPFGDLSTLNFAPSEDIKEEPIRRAYNLVRDYFGASDDPEEG